VDKGMEGLKEKYTNGPDDIGKDFIEPCLRNCISWRRTTYGFSSNALKSWAGSFTNIIENVDKLEILTCITANSNDKVLMQALEHNSTPRERAKTLRIHSENILLTAFSADHSNDSEAFKQTYGWKLLHYLLATEKLVLRFGINTISETTYRQDKYHEKSGYFTFKDDQIIAHYGSFNESESGHRHNNESVMLFSSSFGTGNLAKVTKDDVDRDWEGTEFVEVHKISKETLKRIKENAPSKRPKRIKKIPDIDPDIWEHKKKAIEVFLKRKNGILEMATGTGKTKTALEAAKVLYERGEIDSIICTTRGTDLLDQWYLEFCEWIAKNPSLEELLPFRHYSKNHDIEKYLFDNRNKILVVSRNKSNLKNLLPALSGDEKKRCLVIHDEIHSLGSDSFKEIPGIHKDYIYKLGLSATPDRKYDDDGNELILEEIGPVIFQFTLENAIKKAILCPFNYYPVPYTLSDEEKKSKQKLMSRLSVIRTQGGSDSKEDIYRLMADINKNAESKLGVFRDFVNSNQSFLSSTIVFVNTTDQGKSFIPAISPHTKDYKTYFQGEESSSLDKFAKGKIDCLVACHRVSEGIDIKSLKNIFLVSSDASDKEILNLETTQRIGRCLRSDPDNKNKVANIVDFVLDFDGVDNLSDNVSDHKRAYILDRLSKIEPDND